MISVTRGCPLCGGRVFEAAYEPPRSPGPVGRCVRDGMVFVHRLDDARGIIEAGPRNSFGPHILTSSSVNDIQGSWQLSMIRAREPDWPALRRNAHDALARLAEVVQPPGRLMDFGCGFGLALDVSREEGWDVHGLEPLAGHAVYARAVFGVPVTTDVLRENTFPKSYFDAITAFQVFEHLPSPRAVLDDLRQILRPGGALLIEVPNIDTWSVAMLGGRHRHFVPDHLNFFSAKTLGLLLEQHGFDIVVSYRPTRALTVRYLVGHWGSRSLPNKLAASLMTVVRRTGIQDRVVRLNLGDIIAVIARRPAV